MNVASEIEAPAAGGVASVGSLSMGATAGSQAAPRPVHQPAPETPPRAVVEPLPRAPSSRRTAPVPAVPVADRAVLRPAAAAVAAPEVATVMAPAGEAPLLYAGEGVPAGWRDFPCALRNFKKAQVRPRPII